MKYKHKLFINFVLFISFIEVLAISFNIYISYQDRLQFLAEQAQLLSQEQINISFYDYIIQRLTNNFSSILILFCLNILLVCFVLKWAIKPIEELSESLQRISQNDFKTEIPLLRRDDELGDIARAAHVFKDNALQLESIQDSIQQKIYDHTKVLAKEKKQAERENRIKSKFLANMSHEIRTPLNAILGYAQLAETAAENKKQKDYLHTIFSSAHSLMGIINDILDFSKISANKLEIEETEFNLKDIINKSLEQHIDKAGKKNIELLSMISENLPHYLFGDPHRLTQVLNNLLSNAIKFTKFGEVILFIETIYQDMEYVRLKFTIQDTGIGIEQSKINKLFKAFEQADLSTTREYGGTGLGLSISNQLISLMGGDIHVESQLEQGSSFSFRLPFNVHEIASLPPEKHLQLLNQPLKELNILIINKNRQAASIYKQYFNELSIKSHHIDSLQEFVKQLSDSEQTHIAYDYVLLDDDYKNEDVFHLLKQVHSMAQLKDLKIIFLCFPYQYKKVEESLIKQQVFIEDILLKPLNVEKLMGCFQQIPQEGLHSFDDFDDFDDLWEPDQQQIKDIAGAKILLVEDIDINRELACEILGFWDLNVTTANNGIEAIDCINSAAFDVILMDIQMPEMGGFEATQIIREELKMVDIPIIAMTAMAMIGDKDKLLASGLSDYISKPITIKILFEKLYQWIEPGRRMSLQSSGKLMPKEKTEVDLSEIAAFKHIDIKKGLVNSAGNLKLYKNLLLKFKVRLDNEMDKLPLYIEQQNFEAFRQIVHNIKGISGNLGASNLAKMAKQLELQNITNISNIEENGLSQFIQECQNISNELSVIEVETEVHNIMQEIELSEVLKLIDEINELILKNSFKIDDTIPLLYKALNGHCQASFDLLNNAIEQYDFDHAKTIMKQLLSCINKK